MPNTSKMIDISTAKDLEIQKSLLQLMACIMGHESGQVISDLMWTYLMLACIEVKCHGHVKFSLFSNIVKKVIYGMVMLRVGLSICTICV